jgi:hypothetical protein
MDTEQARLWLARHNHLLVRFVDYQLRQDRIMADKALIGELGQHWFRNLRWHNRHRFQDMGFDGTGGRFVAWTPEGGDQAAVAYFGSEGGAGVLAPSLTAWLQVLAHAPVLLEHDAPASLYVPPPERCRDPSARASYQHAAQRHLGQLAPVEELQAGLGPLNEELARWVASRRQTFSMQDMMRHGLNGSPLSGALRREVCRRLGLTPGNAKRVLAQLNQDPQVTHVALGEVVRQARQALG